ncbi:spherical body protein, putative [Babesia ovis]|uniref:Spherical body protein, putative n=1 Tax=Babesia ovis TaxID=5869 RepID=A0A9W5TEA7_BABOV|nr:spherical body protein, putative [Babesia ovis]
MVVTYKIPLIIVFILVYLCTSLMQCMDVDMSMTDFPNDFNVFHGSFKDNGIYRLVQTKASQVKMVTYGNSIIESLASMGHYIIDIYVEEYKRGDMIIIGVTRACFRPRHFAKRSVYKKISNQFIPITPREKAEFIGGHISITLDWTSTKHHPLLSTALVNVYCKGLVWHCIANTPRGRRSAMLHSIFHDDEFEISPILNIDQTDNGCHPPSMLIARISRLYISPEKGSIVICIDGKLDDEYKLILPPTDDGIFQPKNIFQHVNGINGPLVRTECKNDNKLHIDISTLNTENADIVILANLKRGVWLYTQYSILPYRYSTNTFVVVENRTNNVIYQVPDNNTVVTHVDVFNHIHKDWQYVVVNTLRWNLGMYTEAKVIYKRVYDDNQNGVAYYDVSNFCTGPYHLMLSSINTKPQGDIDIHTIEDNIYRAYVE